MCRIVAILFIIFFFNTVNADSCIHCHSDKQKMEELNYSRFYFTNEEVWNQSNMFRLGLEGPACFDCHLGNPENYTLEGAHEGMPRLLVISREGLKPIERERHIPGLEPRRKGLALTMVPSGIKTILYHDRDPETLAYAPEIANETCGRCHPDAWKDFSNSTMGLQKKSVQYTTFTTPSPHNCGYWLNDYEEIAGEVKVNYTIEQANLNQRKCNLCHASCLDCHYIPYKGNSTHAFSREPPTLSCYFGGGRGICHVGAEDYRRGAGYLREESSIPSLPSDVHATANITCTECHDYDAHEFLREATCIECHREASQGLGNSVHSNVSCEACHIQELGGYQITFWAPGKYWGVESPLAKLNYYGSLSNPILIQDPNRIWIPVKPIPHAVLNQEKGLNQTGIEFRNDSKDAYAVVGAFENLPKNNRAILWLHMDKASHALGKSRECIDCHASGEQNASAHWILLGEHLDSTSFYGRHEIIANSSGLYILNIRNTTEIPNIERAADFAPWIYGLEWNTSGNFLITKISEKSCEEECEKCHLAGYNVHAVINPRYLNVKPLLKATFIIVLAGIAAVIYSLKRKENENR